MTPELTMLAYSVALLLVLIVIQAGIGVATIGLAPLAGARDNLPAPGPLLARAKRVVDNHREGLTLFAPLVLIAAAAGTHNHWTVMGSQLFFYSRVAHAGVYLAGLPVIRPLIYGIGIAGTVMVLLSVLGLLH